MSILTSLLTGAITIPGIPSDCSMSVTIKVESNPKNDSTGSVMNCAVCSDIADGTHFGATSCRSCAAFYRRTISKKLKYICRFDGDCDISKAYRALCRACRLKKCQECGMKSQAVRSECSNIVRPPKAVRKSLTSSTPFNSYDNSLPLPTSIPSTGTSLQTLQIATPQIPNVSSGFITYTSGKASSESSFSSAADSPYASTSSATPPWSQTSPCTMLAIQDEKQQRQPSFIHEIVETNTEEFYVDISQLPATHPLLMKILISYETLQRRRDERFSRARDCDGKWSRVFLRRETFDVHRFYQMTQVEIELIAAMLQSFDGYRELPHADKVEIFKEYWIHFVILERNFDTFRVLGADQNDRRIVFANGDIVDVLHCNYDLTQVTDAPVEEVRRMCHPWYRMSAQELIAPVKKLQPREEEMSFCLGIMLWQFSAEVANKLSPATVEFAERMIASLHTELATFYSQVYQPENVVQRVADLMKLIALTERLIFYRREDIVLTRAFQTFKVDIYFDDLLRQDV